MNVACCLAVKNCGEYLERIFHNLNELSTLFKNFYVIFVYDDNTTDNSPQLLEDYKNNSNFKVYTSKLQSNNSPFNTCRIARARNECLRIVYSIIKCVDFHFVIDADDVNCYNWDIALIERYLTRNDWDALSFNRPDYYDIWALLFDNYKHHCWGFNNSNSKIVEIMRQDIQNRLSKTEDLLDCYSAFNGFGIYRTSKFKNCFYSGLYKDIKRLISDKERQETIDFLKENKQIETGINNNFVEQCEHIYYHMSASKLYNARIVISRFNLII